VDAVLDLPLLGTEPADEEQDDADGQVREHDTQPDVRVERVHEREDARLLLLRLFDHDADAEVHERFAEVDDSLSRRSDRYWSDRNVSNLHITIAITYNYNNTWRQSTTNPVPVLRIAASRGFSELTKNVTRSSYGHSTPSLKISCKSVQPFSRNLANKEQETKI